MDRTKQLFLRVLAPISILILFILTWSLFRYISVDDSKSYTRLTMHEFYQQDNIDVLFMGASHCYRGFDTEVTDRMLGCNTFNLGTSSQLADATVLLMKEAVARYRIQHIYVDLSYFIATMSMERGDSMTSVYLVTDHLHPSLRKALFLLKRSGGEDLANSFLIARRKWQNLFDPQHVSDTLRTKRDMAYQEYRYVRNPNEDYIGKGFVRNYETAPEGSFFDAGYNEHFDLQAIQPRWTESVREMIRCCRECGVELTFLSAPISTYRLLCYGHYDDYIALVEQILAESGNGVEYIDFNLIRPEYWPDTSMIFKDPGHLNGNGAQLFSEIFCRYVSGEIPAEDLFYPSVQEKLADLSPGFYGIEVFPVLVDDEWFCDCKLIVGSPSAFESRVFLPGEDGETVLKELSDSLTFRIPSSYRGDCCVELLFSDGTKQEYTVNFVNIY